jgi:hypothetical protein
MRRRRIFRIAAWRLPNSEPMKSQIIRISLTRDLASVEAERM